MDTEEKLVEQGFYKFHTGGGCLALRKEFKDGTYMLVTDEGGSSYDNIDKNLMVGFFEEGGETVFIVENKNLFAEWK